MKDFPPNVDPKLATISAVIIGFALIDNFSADEQGAIGNWFITIGQVLFNNASWQRMIEARIQGDSININSEKYKRTGNPYMNDAPWMKSPSNQEIERLKKIVAIMQQEVENMQQKKNY